MLLLLLVVVQQKARQTPAGGSSSSQAGRPAAQTGLHPVPDCLLENFLSIFNFIPPSLSPVLFHLAFSVVGLFQFLVWIFLFVLLGFCLFVVRVVPPPPPSFTLSLITLPCT